jgi:hypothetical protein
MLDQVNPSDASAVNLFSGPLISPFDFLITPFSPFLFFFFEFLYPPFSLPTFFSLVLGCLRIGVGMYFLGQSKK